MAGLMKVIRRKKDPNAEHKEDAGGPSVLAETIEKIALEVDYHGLADLYEASSWYARLFWSVIVIGALGAVIHDCYNIIRLFASDPSATKISEFSVKFLELPNVTVCNMGAFNQTELRGRLTAAGEPNIQRQNDFIRYMMIMAYQTPPGNDTLALDYEHPSKKLWDSMIKDVNETLAFLRETAYQCEGFLSDCEFAENPFDCCENDIFVYTDLGGCYTIRASNATGPTLQTGRDSAAGISVTTEMDVTEIAILEEWKSVGLRLQFGDYVSPFDFSTMLHLPPGMLALVRLSPVRYVLDAGVSECWVVEPKLTYHDGYSTGLCKHDCVLKYTVKTCGCMPYGYSTKHAERHRTCTIEEMRTCVLAKVWNTENGTDPTEIQQCKRTTCLRMCTYWVHEPYLMLSQLRQDANAVNSTKRTNVLNVYFGYMRYTQTEAAQLMTFDTFVSNLGGAIGLWTGMSLISVVQMLIYGWEGFWRKVERRRAEKMIRTMLAQYPAQNNGAAPDKPVRVTGSMFVKPSVHFGASQTSGQKNGQVKSADTSVATIGGFQGKDVAAEPPRNIKNGLSFVARLKSLFKRGDVIQPADVDVRSNDSSRADDLPPDPKPRPASGDESSGTKCRLQSLDSLFEPPPTTVGAGPPSPLATVIDERGMPKKEIQKGAEAGFGTRGYSNPGTLFSHNESVDSRSWTTETTSTRPCGPASESNKARAPHHNVARNSRGAAGGRNAAPVRKRTQSEHKHKRHPMGRARY